MPPQHPCFASQIGNRKNDHARNHFDCRMPNDPATISWTIYANHLMTNSLFPNTLTRKQYVIRFLAMVGIVIVAMFVYVGAPTGTAVQIAGIVFILTALVAFLYNIFALSLPRLRSAQISVWALLLFLIPGGPVIMFLICVIAREKT
jgi:hypothetical protein